VVIFGKTLGTTLLIIGFLSNMGCNTINMTSSFEVDTQESKRGTIIPHATFKVSFEKKEKK